jgi:hypothetical protein
MNFFYFKRIRNMLKKKHFYLSVKKSLIFWFEGYISTGSESSLFYHNANNTANTSYGN